MENISVSVRLRALSKQEEKEGFAWKVDGRCIIPVDGDARRDADGRRDNNDARRASNYTADHVFGPECPTGRVYQEAIEALVHDAVEGKNVTIMTYGQTGSGKTYTMGTPENPGVVQRALVEMFGLIAKKAEREFLLRFSYLEIYNETVTDLLSPDKVPKNLLIKEDRVVGPVVLGLSEEIVTCPEDVLRLLKLGETKRRVASSKMNERSNRSHAVARMVLESRPAGSPNAAASTTPLVMSSLVLVDLAGSESVAKTGAEGERLKESSAINKSLLALGEVVYKLSEGALAAGAHIPYRDSKLTRILKPSLGGNAKTVIICTVNPAVRHIEESHRTLRFACRAKRVVNTVVVTEVVSETAALRWKAKELKEQQRRKAEAEMAASVAARAQIAALKSELLRSEEERVRAEREAEAARQLLVLQTLERVAETPPRVPLARTHSWSPGASSSTTTLDADWMVPDADKSTVVMKDNPAADVDPRTETGGGDMEALPGCSPQLRRRTTAEAGDTSAGGAAGRASPSAAAAVLLETCRRVRGGQASSRDLQELIERWRLETSRLQDENTVLRQDLQPKLKQELQWLTATIASHEALNTQLQTERDAALQLVEGLQAENAELKREVAELTRELAGKAAAAAAAEEGAAEELTRLHQADRAAAVEWSVALAAANARAGELESLVRHLQKEVEAANATVESDKARHRAARAEALEAAAARHDAAMRGMMEQVAALRAELEAERLKLRASEAARSTDLALAGTRSYGDGGALQAAQQHAAAESHLRATTASLDACLNHLQAASNMQATAGRPPAVAAGPGTLLLLPAPQPTNSSSSSSSAASAVRPPPSALPRLPEDQQQQLLSLHLEDSQADSGQRGDRQHRQGDYQQFQQCQQQQHNYNHHCHQQQRQQLYPEVSAEGLEALCLHYTTADPALLEALPPTLPPLPGLPSPPPSTAGGALSARTVTSVGGGVDVGGGTGAGTSRSEQDPDQQGGRSGRGWMSKWKATLARSSSSLTSAARSWSNGSRRTTAEDVRASTARTLSTGTGGATATSSGVSGASALAAFDATASRGQVSSDGVLMMVSVSEREQLTDGPHGAQPMVRTGIDAAGGREGAGGGAAGQLVVYGKRPGYGAQGGATSVTADGGGAAGTEAQQVVAYGDCRGTVDGNTGAAAATTADEVVKLAAELAAAQDLARRQEAVILDLEGQLGSALEEVETLQQQIKNAVSHPQVSPPAGANPDAAEPPTPELTAALEAALEAAEVALLKAESRAAALVDERDAMEERMTAATAVAEEAREALARYRRGEEGQGTPARARGTPQGARGGGVAATAAAVAAARAEAEVLRLLEEVATLKGELESVVAAKDAAEEETDRVRTALEECQDRLRAAISETAALRREAQQRAAELSATRRGLEEREAKLAALRATLLVCELPGREPFGGTGGEGTGGGGGSGEVAAGAAGAATRVPARGKHATPAKAVPTTPGGHRTPGARPAAATLLPPASPAAAVAICANAPMASPAGGPGAAAALVAQPRGARAAGAGGSKGRRVVVRGCQPGTDPLFRRSVTSRRLSPREKGAAAVAAVGLTPAAQRRRYASDDDATTDESSGSPDVSRPRDVLKRRTSTAAGSKARNSLGSSATLVSELFERLDRLERIHKKPATLLQQQPLSRATAGRVFRKQLLDVKAHLSSTGCDLQLTAPNVEKLDAGASLPRGGAVAGGSGAAIAGTGGAGVQTATVVGNAGGGAGPPTISAQLSVTLRGVR